MSLLKKLFGKRPENPNLKNISLEFAAMLDASRVALNHLTEMNQSGWDFGNHQHYEMKQDEEILRFFFKDGTVAECAFQAIGSFSTVDDTWAWAWDNPSINESLKTDAKSLYRYGQEHEIALLTTPLWPADMNWAWSMTALAVSRCESSGAFCAMAGPMRLFLSFRDVKLSRIEV